MPSDTKEPKLNVTTITKGGVESNLLQYLLNPAQAKQSQAMKYSIY